LTAIDFKQNI